jgi:hypothetical protein
MAAVGGAFLEPDANRIPAARGADLPLDDLALTGNTSRMDLRLGRAIHIKLGARSQLKIDRFIMGASADVQLWYQFVLYDVLPTA